MKKKNIMVLALFQRDINCYAALSGRCRPPRLARPHGRAVPRGGRQADAPSSAAAALLLRRRQRAATRAFNKYPSVEAIGQKAAWAAEAGHEGLWGLTGLACPLQGAWAGPAPRGPCLGPCVGSHQGRPTTRPRSMGVWRGVMGPGRATALPRTRNYRAR